MSARFVPISWTPAKRVYDAALLVGVLGYILAFQRLAPWLVEATGRSWDGPDGATLAMQAQGTCAFLLLTLALAIGPLARLDPRFAPLLYNRRHLGVVTCLVALSHAIAVLGWHFAFSPTPPLLAMLTTEPLAGPPFVPFGLLALGVLIVLAATSHDFWLAFLGPPAWKALHMAIYPAYALVVAHVAFGALQDGGRGGVALVVTGGAALVVALHLAAARRARVADAEVAAAAAVPWVAAGRADAIPEGRAIILRPPEGEAVAIFRHDGRLSAVSNLCAHQNGPLGEGRIVDGCITCPWHGFQYRPEDGCAPPPYTEKLSTYALRLDGPMLWLDPRPHPPGTRIEPLAVPLPARSGAGAPFFIGWARGLPPGLRAHVVGAVAAIALGLPLLGLGLGLAAGDPAGRDFATVPGQALPPDLPQGASLRGVILAGPYTLLHLPAERRTLLLARDGKEGAAPEWRALHGRLVTAEGFILRRGSIEMLVPAAPPVPVDDAPALPVPVAEPLGRWRLQGEICDGKCAAGGMRPGTGIAHRACATLCLDGGMPAVFVTTGAVEGHAFLLLADAEGGPALPALRDLVGRRVTLDGEVERLGHLLVFRAARP